MTQHALEVLEFERVLERVSARASSEVGRDRVRALRPRHDVASVSRELARVSAVLRFVDTAPSWGPGPIPEVGDELAQLGVDGSVLDPIGLYRLGQLLGTSRGLLGTLDGHADGYPELSSLRDRLLAERTLEGVIERSVDDDGTVLSSASPELKRIRDRLRGAQAKIVRSLEKYLGTLPERFVVPDASITIRDGRYVIPVRREGKGEVGGIVHDESQTGATLYVEPPAAIQAMNQLRDLEREEGREIRRVLGALTEQIAPLGTALQGAWNALADFDSLHARARTASAWNAVPPLVSAEAPGALVLREARHPLLVEAAEAPVVPYDLTLEADERCLVISGPNTGGKSVFLKATGLIAALTQSGVVPPVGRGTQIPVFGSFFADIGDEQSIARNLSTFSAHLANLSELVSAADERSLVLIDEMGTGTDPTEGAALSKAVLEELVACGATTVVSSHLGELKQLDGAGSGIVNASLQFDSELMQPTYRLLKGRPGRSYGLAIARRLGFPGHVLDRADTYLDDGARRMEDVLERLEQQEKEVERLLHELDVERRKTERLRAEVETRETTLEEAERTAEDRARSDARKLLMEARTEVEEAIEHVRGAAEKGLDLDEAAREARRKVEKAAGRHKEQSEKRRGRQRSRSDEGTIEAGAHVRMSATGARGSVVERRADRVLVEVGSLRLEVPVADVELVDPPTAPKAGDRAGGWTGPSRGQAQLEVDLRANAGR